jgi:hypothetical protein
MTRFLRFDIGGASALLWMLLFLSPYLNIGALTQVDAIKLFAVVFGSITLSIPLGNYIHQFTDSVLNPFARCRLMIWPRASVAYIENVLGSVPKFHDNLYQVVLVFAKAYERTVTTTEDDGAKKGLHSARESSVELKIEILREEVANWPAPGLVDTRLS